MARDFGYRTCVSRGFARAQSRRSAQPLRVRDVCAVGPRLPGPSPRVRPAAAPSGVIAAGAHGGGTAPALRAAAAPVGATIGNSTRTV